MLTLFGWGVASDLAAAIVSADLHERLADWLTHSGVASGLSGYLICTAAIILEPVGVLCPELRGCPYISEVRNTNRQFVRPTLWTVEGYHQIYIVRKALLYGMRFMPYFYLMRSHLPYIRKGGSASRSVRQQVSLYSTPDAVQWHSWGTNPGILGVVPDSHATRSRLAPPD